MHILRVWRSGVLPDGVTDTHTGNPVPITAFVAWALEHSVANMYFVLAGCWRKAEPQVRTCRANQAGRKMSPALQFPVEQPTAGNAGNIAGGNFARWR